MAAIEHHHGVLVFLAVGGPGRLVLIERLLHVGR
jgi:hypothetical protein